MRVVFLGSPAFALPSLEALLSAGHEVGLVVTQPDRPAGRGQKTRKPPVAEYAIARGLPVWQTHSLRGPAAEARLREVAAEAMALAAFAALVPTNVLGLTPNGILNVHPSLLPRWRGAAPIQSALRAGDPVTGVSIIRLVEALDAGPILLQESETIAPEDDYVSLEPRLAALGARLLVSALAERPEPWPQSAADATYSSRINREDARIDWSSPAEEIWNQVRAYRGWPQAFTIWDGQQLKILRARPIEPSLVPPIESVPLATPRDGSSSRPGAASVSDRTPIVETGSGFLRLDEIQLEGKRAQSGAEFLRGHPRFIGATLGVQPKTW